MLICGMSMPSWSVNPAFLHVHFFNRLQQELGLPADLLTRGKRTRTLSLRLAEAQRPCVSQQDLSANAVAAPAADGTAVAAGAAAGLKRPQHRRTSGYSRTEELMGADRASSMAPELELGSSISRAEGPAGVGTDKVERTPTLTSERSSSTTTATNGEVWSTETNLAAGAQEMDQSWKLPEVSGGLESLQHSLMQDKGVKAGMARAVSLPAGTGKGKEDVDRTTRLALLAAWQASLQAQVQMHLRAAQQPQRPLGEGEAPPTPYNSSGNSPAWSVEGRSSIELPVVAVEARGVSPASCKRMLEVCGPGGVTAPAKITSAAAAANASVAVDEPAVSAALNGPEVLNGTEMSSSTPCSCWAEGPTNGKALGSQWQDQQQQAARGRSKTHLSACSSNCPSCRAR
jgi:hypothetical protein